MILEMPLITWSDLDLPPMNLWNYPWNGTNNRGEYMDNPFDVLRTPEYSEYIYKSRYARWIEDEGRREEWGETVTRYLNFFIERLGGEYSEEDSKLYARLYDAISSFKVMPSMRSLMTAGPALDRDNVAGYNCASIAIDDPKAFDEIMYVLMCGTGMGFSVERQYVSKLPVIAEEFYKTDTVIYPRDSKIGWAAGYRELVSLLYSGQIPKWDLSKIRPAGAKLKTFGGRASGPQPLDDLFRFTVAIFKQAAGRKLTSIECHDIVCKVADIVVVGGVRRSALISLSNLSDDRMRVAKSGQWWDTNGQRALANNSVAYTEKPDVDIFMKEMLALYESKSGERGIYNREATNNLLPTRRKELGYTEWLCNPCSEINLRANGQMCNLSEVIVRPEDTLETLLEKIELATILGTLQATLTNFRYLRKQWSRNCEEESLLGVSLTGILDHPVLSGQAYLDSQGEDIKVSEWLNKMKEKAIEVNSEWSDRLGIQRATAITCVKPSGTVSQLCDTASGIHPRYSEYYVRTVRADNKDPLCIMMKEQGISNEPDVMKQETGTIFSFPIKSPDLAILRNDRTAIQQLEIWKLYQLEWCEHKPSVTIYVRDKEWLEVFSWVYSNFDIVSGISFLPHSDHTYKQAPYQEIMEEEYEDLIETQNHINWNELPSYETEDTTTSTKEYACSGGSCELV